MNALEIVTILKTHFHLYSFLRNAKLEENDMNSNSIVLGLKDKTIDGL